MSNELATITGSPAAPAPEPAGAGHDRWARPTADRRVLGLMAVLVALATGVVLYRLSGWFTDDAYITLRFARRLVSGDGWTYNRGGQTANGATSPAYTVAVAVLSVPLRTAPRAANLVFVASFVAVAVLLTVTFDRRRAPYIGIAATVALLACPLIAATKGMESLLFLALVCAVLCAVTTDRDVAFGLCAALLVLVRGEGALLAGLLFAQLWVTRRRLPVRALVAGALVAVPWVAYSLMVFGTVLPDTLSAKVAQGQSGFWGHGPIFLRGFTSLATPLHYQAWLWVVVPLAVAGLVRGGADRRLRPVVGPLVAATVLHAVVYGLVLDVPPYHWYYAWEMFTLAVLAALSVGWVVERGTELAGSAPVRQRVGRAATIGLSVMAVAVAAVVHVGPSAAPSYYLENQRYVELGLWLKANTPPTARVAATEIGALGWYSDRPIVDYLGLLDTTSADDVRRGDLVSWLGRERPDYWVVHDPLWPHEAPAAATPFFHRAYRPVFTGGPNVAGYRLVVYARVGGAGPG